jgi:hypothetical protein
MDWHRYTERSQVRYFTFATIVDRFSKYETCKFYTCVIMCNAKTSLVPAGISPYDDLIYISHPHEDLHRAILFSPESYPLGEERQTVAGRCRERHLGVC